MNILSLLIRLLFSAVVYFLPDLILHSAVKKAWGKMQLRWYWRINVLLFVLIGISTFVMRDSALWLQRLQLFFLGLFVALLFAKVVVAFLLFAEYLVRLVNSIATRRRRQRSQPDTPLMISRRQFIAKGAILTGLLPFTGMLYGMFKGRFRYTLHSVEIPIANLPEAFDGFTITQLSDLHICSFEKSTRDEL